VKPPAITPAQRAVLQRAADNGGIIEIGGLDGDTARRDVIWRLYEANMLSYVAPRQGGGQPWRLTEAGRAALAIQRPVKTAEKRSGDDSHPVS
jgi:hypothetical protein